MKKETFKLTEQHIKLLRSMYVEYNDYCETGAPAIDPKRPYGNSSVAEDIHEIIGGGKSTDEITDKQADKYLALHRQTGTALQIVLATGKFEPGTYEKDLYSIGWRKKG